MDSPYSVAGVGQLGRQSRRRRKFGRRIAVRARRQLPPRPHHRRRRARQAERGPRRFRRGASDRRWCFPGAYPNATTATEAEAEAETATSTRRTRVAVTARRRQLPAHVEALVELGEGRSFLKGVRLPWRLRLRLRWRCIRAQSAVTRRRLCNRLHGETASWRSFGPRREATMQHWKEATKTQLA